jgi:hypothetical protein
LVDLLFFFLKIFNKCIAFFDKFGRCFLSSRSNIFQNSKLISLRNKFNITVSPFLIAKLC